MEEMQIEAGTVTAIPQSEVDQFIAAVEAKPDASYPGSVVASMLRMVSRASGPPFITVHPKPDGRKGRKRTEEQRQRMADAARRRWAKRRDSTQNAEGGDVGDVKTFPAADQFADAGDGGPGVAALAGDAGN